MPYTDPLNSVLGLPQSPEDEEQSLLRELAAKGMTGLQYVGESLDKPGQAIRGLLAGKPKELLNLIPFSDAIGLTSSEGYLGRKFGMNVTDDEDAVSGRDLLEQWGAFGPNEEELDTGDVAGLAAEILLDPSTYYTGGMTAFTKLGKAFKNAGLLGDIATQARRAKLPVHGAASARNKLTGQHVLDAFTDPDEKANAIQRLLNSHFQGDAVGKTIADIPAEELAKPLGGLFNLRIPFQEAAGFGPGWTVHAEPLAARLDKTVGYARYGNPVGRGLNRMFSAAHSKGGAGESRYAQEFLIPNERLAIEEANNRLNPKIAQGSAAILQNEDELLRDVADQNLNREVYRVAEGFEPDVGGIAATNRDFSQTAAQMQRDAGLQRSDLVDEFIKDYAVRGKLYDPNSMEGIAEQTTRLQQGRNQALKNLPGGTGDVDDMARFAAEAMLPGPLQLASRNVDETVSVKNALADMLRQQFPETPATFDTLKGIRAKQRLADPNAAVNYSAKELERLNSIVKKETDRDRFKALASIFSEQPVENLRAGLFGSLPDAQRRYANAVSNSVGRAQAFRDAISDPRLFENYGTGAPQPMAQGELKRGQVVNAADRGNFGKILSIGDGTARVRFVNPQTQASATVELPLDQLTRRNPDKSLVPTGFVSTQQAAKQLGLDPGAFLDAPELIPEQLVKDIVGPDRRQMVQLPTWLKDLTQINKSFMTGAITNPSFAARNRASGGATNVYTGITSPLAALTGLFKSAIGQNPGQLLARGKTIPGAKDALEAQAALVGRTLKDDVDATNFARELYAAYGGNFTRGMTTADALADNQMGVGEFVGGMKGPEGEEAFSWPRVAKETAGVWDQLRGRDGGWKELVAGAPGVTALNKDGIRRTEPTSALLKSGQTVNDYVEAQNRFNPFFEMVSKGVDPAEAMRRVNRAQIDYSGRAYTPFETNVLSQLIPFWKFQKSSALMHANELAERPGGALSHLLQTTGQLSDPNEVLPEHVKEKLSIPVEAIPLIGKYLASGDEDTKRYLTGLGLAYEDPLTFITGGPGELPVNREVLQEGLGRLNPLLKAIGELTTGRSFFQRDETGSGRLIEEQDPPLGRLISNLRQIAGEEVPKELSKQHADDSSFGVIGESVLANSPASRMVSALKNLTDQRPNALPKSLLNYFTGLRSSDVTPQMIDAVIRGQMNEDIRQMPYAKTRSTAYVPKYLRDQLPEDKLEKLADYRMLDRILNRRQKERMRQMQQEADPLAFMLGL